MYDSGVGAFSQHWLDVFVAALIACVGWLGRDRFRAMDARHQRAEDKFDEVDQEIGDCKERIARLEGGRISAE